MTTTTKRSLGGFSEKFWSHEKVGDKITGVFDGMIEKDMKDAKGKPEKREFGVIRVEGEDKPYIIGGRDFLNKIKEAKVGEVIEVVYKGKEKFTPKGTSSKVNINRYDVFVIEGSK